MKPILISSLTLIILSFSGIIYSQQLHTVYLNEETDDYVTPMELYAQPGDQIRFTTTGGDFKITIPNANKFLNVKVSTLIINLTSTGTASQTYNVIDIKEQITQAYDVVCTSGGGIPSAPPKIIIITAE